MLLQAALVAGDFRRTVHKKLIAMEERQIAAERRTDNAKTRVQLISSDVESARAHVARLLAINQRLKGTMKSEEEWSKKGRRAAFKGVVLGPISLEVGAFFPCISCLVPWNTVWCCVLPALKVLCTAW